MAASKRVVPAAIRPRADHSAADLQRARDVARECFAEWKESAFWNPKAKARWAVLLQECPWLAKP